MILGRVYNVPVLGLRQMNSAVQGLNKTNYLDLNVLIFGYEILRKTRLLIVTENIHLDITW